MPEEITNSMPKGMSEAMPECQKLCQIELQASDQSVTHRTSTEGGETAGGGGGGGGDSYHPPHPCQKECQNICQKPLHYGCHGGASHELK